MASGQEWNKEVREKMEAAHGFHELGMHNDAWTTLDDLLLFQKMTCPQPIN